MKISTQLFNQQQVKTFGKLTEDIQNLQAKIASGKNRCQLIASELMSFPSPP